MGQVVVGTAIGALRVIREQPVISASDTGVDDTASAGNCFSVANVRHGRMN